MPLYAHCGYRVFNDDKRNMREQKAKQTQIGHDDMSHVLLHLGRKPEVEFVISLLGKERMNDYNKVLSKRDCTETVSKRKKILDITERRYHNFQNWVTLA